MEIDHLREFVYLAETLSFRRTAEKFYVNKSVISRHLASIEEVIGTKLVERTNHAVQLTSVGKVFLRDAKNILRAYDLSLDHARIAKASQGMVVHIGYLRNAARPVIVHFMQFMKDHHPEVKLTLTCMEYSELRRAMEDGVVDVALAVNVVPAISRNYRSTSIYTDRFFAVMNKSHPLANRTEGITLDDLPEEKLLLPDSFVYSGLSELIDGLVESNSRLVAREYYNDVDMLYIKVQTEDYVAFSSSMNNAMFGDRLAIIPVVGIDTRFSVSAFYGNAFTGAAFSACKEAFEACRDLIPESSPGFTLEYFD